MSELSELKEKLAKAEEIIDIAKDILRPPRFDGRYFETLEAMLLEYDGWDWREEPSYMRNRGKDQ